MVVGHGWVGHLLCAVWGDWGIYVCVGIDVGRLG